jgi:hypothetical protein
MGAIADQLPSSHPDPSSIDTNKKGGVMDANFKVINPDDIELELTLTANLKTWQEFEGQLTRAWPSGKVAQEVSNMIRHDRPDTQGQHARDQQREERGGHGHPSSWSGLRAEFGPAFKDAKIYS